MTTKKGREKYVKRVSIMSEKHDIYEVVLCSLLFQGSPNHCKLKLKIIDVVIIDAVNNMVLYIQSLKKICQAGGNQCLGYVRICDSNRFPLAPVGFTVGKVIVWEVPQ